MTLERPLTGKLVLGWPSPSTPVPLGLTPLDSDRSS